mgnify:FL=1
MIALIIGNGGREHALAWKISQAPNVSKVYVAPGNGGTATADSIIENIDLIEFDDLVKFAKEKRVDLTIVGPEIPLSNGLVDYFQKNGLKIFGPTQKAAQLESSKDFAKKFMVKHGIPTAEHQTFSDIQLAHDYVELKGAPIVIKADGLAAGKGVVVALTLKEAHDAIDSMLSKNIFGDAGAQVVIEEFLDGEEVSFIAICDGDTVLPLASSQDHKRLQDDDLGPNTGGMGAYSPAPIVTDEMHEKIMKQVITPTIEGMKKDGVIFKGFLYAGLMINADKQIKTLEFNCRMGDPETQPILFRLKSNLYDILLAATDNNLSDFTAEWEDVYSITVVMASHNYPSKPRLNDEIHIPLMVNENCFIFHAGTKLKDNKTLTSGGRVLGVTAKAKSLQEAKNIVYKFIQDIKFDGAQFRKDIGKKALDNYDSIKSS